MQFSQKIFIIGADGQIGRYLYHRLKQETGGNIIGSTRRKSKLNTDTLYLDLEDAECTPENIELNPQDVVIFTAAITKGEICQNNPERSYHVNVKQTIKYL